MAPQWQEASRAPEEVLGFVMVPEGGVFFLPRWLLMVQNYNLLGANITTNESCTGSRFRGVVERFPAISSWAISRLSSAYECHDPLMPLARGSMKDQWRRLRANAKTPQLYIHHSPVPRTWEGLRYFRSLGNTLFQLHLKRLRLHQRSIERYLYSSTSYMRVFVGAVNHGLFLL